MVGRKECLMVNTSRKSHVGSMQLTCCRHPLRGEPVCLCWPVAPDKVFVDSLSPMVHLKPAVLEG